MKYDKIANAYIQMIESLYQEGSESTATHNNKEYKLDVLFKLTHNKPITNIDVSKLDWILPYTKTDPKRVSVADVSVPLLVYNDLKYGLTAIDGAHRLKKASMSNIKQLPTKLLSDSDMKAAEIIKKENQ